MSETFGEVNFGLHILVYYTDVDFTKGLVEKININDIVEVLEGGRIIWDSLEL